MNDLDIQRWYEAWYEAARDAVAPKRDMCMSCEALLYFIGLVRPGEYILDCGAGVSTWVLRKLFPGRVMTIDSDRHYLSRVLGVCGKAGLDVTQFSEGFGARWLHLSDCTLFDYAHMPTRANYLHRAWDYTTRLMYCDDADTRPAFRRYREAVYAFAAEVGATATDCEQCVDEYGRWGVLLTREEVSNAVDGPSTLAAT